MTVTRRTTRPTTTTRTTATTTTPKPKPATPKPTTTTPAAGVQSGAGNVKVPLTAVQGFSGKTWSAPNAVPRAGTTPTASSVSSIGVRQAGGGYSRGKIEVESKAVDDKSFSVTVKTMHSGGSLQGGDDKMSLMLQARVQDGDKEGIINLAILKDNVACNNKGKWNGEHTFRFAHEDINKYLQSLHPGLKLVPGAKLAVAARWAGGHTWGGFGRLGDFEVPMPPKSSPLSTRLPGAGVVKPLKPTGTAASLPLDISYTMPTSLSRKNPAFFGSQVTVSSRLETELKGRLKENVENEAAIARLYLMSGDQKELDKALGKGFTLKPHTEWWSKDKKGAFVDSKRMKKYANPDNLIKAGLAKNKTEANALAKIFANLQMGEPLPLEDIYKSTKGELAESVVSRIRSNAIAEGVHNLKPGPGVLLADIDKAHKNSPSGLIRKRIEYGMTLKDKKVPRADLEEWLKKTDSPYNPAGRALRELMPKGTSDKTPIGFTMMQERHRFTLEHKDGLSIDISVDFVNVEHKGKKVSIPMVEMEIDHLYFGKGNNASSATPTSIRSFSTETEQKTWSKALTGNASLNGLPRFHELADLQDKSIWESKEQKQTEKIIDSLFPMLYPKGAVSSAQKGVAVAQDLGLI
ncbi:MAG: hypothetical protein Q8O67_09275 [Deltaproteobacteria bacterium]|nr:hypothetical protein [Deltaproteobacteria bacterium]